MNEKEERKKFEEWWPNLQKCFTPDVHTVIKAGACQAWLERARLDLSLRIWYGDEPIEGGE